MAMFCFAQGAWAQTFETIGLQPGSDATGVNFNWYSPSADGNVSWVRILSADGNTVIKEEQGSYRATTATSGRSEHKVSVTGLTQGTEYKYQLSSNKTNWSTIYDYKTTPEGKFTFAAVTDAQINVNKNSNSNSCGDNYDCPETWQTTMTKLNEAKVNFIVHTGDQVDAQSGLNNEYIGFFSPPELRRIPFAPVMGNHDSHCDFMYRYNLPNEYQRPTPCTGTTAMNASSNTVVGVHDAGNYYFLQNNVLFVGLNTSYYPNSVTAAEPYITRYRNTIDAAKDKYNEQYDFIVVFHHKSTQTIASHAADPDVEYYVKAGFEKLMTDNKVSLVLAGHDHINVRSKFLVWNDELKMSVPNETVAHPNQATYPCAESGANASRCGPFSTTEGINKGTIYLTLSTSSGLKYYSPYANGITNSNTFPYLVNGKTGRSNLNANNPLIGMANTPGRLDTPEYSIVEVDGETITLVTYKNTDGVNHIDRFVITTDNIYGGKHRNQGPSAEKPVIATQPTDKIVTVGDAETVELSVSVKNVNDGGTLSYQWYSNATNSNSGGTPISGATAATYNVPTTTAGTTYYYVVVTNAITVEGVKYTKSVPSNVAMVKVNAQPTEGAIAVTATWNAPQLGSYGYVKGEKITAKFEGGSITLTLTEDEFASKVKTVMVDGQKYAVTLPAIPSTQIKCSSCEYYFGEINKLQTLPSGGVTTACANLNLSGEWNAATNSTSFGSKWYYHFQETGSMKSTQANKRIFINGVALPDGVDHTPAQVKALAPEAPEGGWYMYVHSSSNAQTFNVSGGWKNCEKVFEKDDDEEEPPITGDITVESVAWSAPQLGDTYGYVKGETVTATITLSNSVTDKSVTRKLSETGFSGEETIVTIGGTGYAIKLPAITGEIRCSSCEYYLDEINKLEIKGTKDNENVVNEKVYITDVASKCATIVTSGVNNTETTPSTVTGQNATTAGNTTSFANRYIHFTEMDGEITTTGGGSGYERIFINGKGLALSNNGTKHTFDQIKTLLENKEAPEGGYYMYVQQSSQPQIFNVSGGWKNCEKEIKDDDPIDEPISIANAIVTVNGTYTYTGEKIVPFAGNVTVKLDGVTLTEYTFDVTNNIDAGTATVTVTGTGSKYTGSVTGTFEIGRATPSITTLPTASGITYGAALSTSTLLGGVGNIAGEFAWTDGATIPTVTNNGYSVTFTPTDAANYNTTTGTVGITVSPKEITLDWSGYEDLVYDGNAKNVTAIANGLVGDDVCEVTVTGGKETNAGAYTAKASGLGNSNYGLSDDVTQDYTIVPKLVTLAWSGYENLEYDGTAKDVTATTQGLVEGDECDVTVEGGTETNAGGPYTARATELSNPNYILPGDVTQTYTIAKASGSGSVTMDNWTYGETANNPIPTSTTNGTESVIYEYSVRNVDDYKTDVPRNAGNYTVRATFAETGNYLINTSTADFEITPKTVSIDVTVADKEYDGITAATVKTAEVRGAIVGDDVTAKSGTASFADKNVGPNKAVIFRDFSLDGADVGNYTLSAQPVSVTADITQKTITITGVTAIDRDYDGTTTVELADGEFSGVVDGDYVDVELGFGTITDASAGDNKPVETTITLSGVDAENYRLAQPTGITVNIKEILPPTCGVDEEFDENGGCVPVVIQPTQYTVTFVDWDGKELKTEPVTHGGEATAPITDPTREGYTFKNWDTDFSNVTGNLTVKALYDVIPYSITYNLDGGVVSPANANPTTYNIETADITLTEPMKAGYTFTGWTGENGTTPQIDVTIARGSFGNKAYTANWTVNELPTYTITFNANGGAVDPTSGKTGAGGKLAELPEPTRVGYTFGGWFTAVTGGERVELSKVYSVDATIFANWTQTPVTPDTYTVTFSAGSNGAVAATVDGATIVSGAAVEEGKSVIFTATPDEGYRVSGWTKDGESVNETNTTYTLANITAVATVSVSFEAVPAPTTFTVTFNANGGTVNPASGKADENGKLAVLPTPSRDGHRFDGWFTAATGGAEVTAATEYTENTTIYAQWTHVTSITIQPTNGTITAGNGYVLKVEAEIKVAGGELSYQWYSNNTASNVGGTPLAGAATATHTVTISAAGTYYYYAVVTYTPPAAMNKAKAQSNSGVVTVTSAVITVTVTNGTGGSGGGGGGGGGGRRGGTTDVLEAERVVPQVKPNEEAIVVAPVTVLLNEFTAGPNPVARHLGAVNFFRQGKRVNNCELRIYDATGNVVGKVKINDNALGNNVRRQVGSWDLKDKNGRLVPEGTYLIRGVVWMSDGKKEKVSVIVGVR